MLQQVAEKHLVAQEKLQWLAQAWCKLPSIFVFCGCGWQSD